MVFCGNQIKYLNITEHGDELFDDDVDDTINLFKVLSLKLEATFEIVKIMSTSIYGHIQIVAKDQIS